MNVLILGADGYIGWPAMMYFSKRGHTVLGIDNYIKRKFALEVNEEPLFPIKTLPEKVRYWNNKHDSNKMECKIGDITNYKFLYSVIEEFKPTVILHYAEQPSSPWSMFNYENGRRTITNNLIGTYNLLEAIKEIDRNIVLIKLGTSGEFTCPNTAIPADGFLEYEYKGRKDRRLYPREGPSVYHMTKIMDTDLIWFFCRTFGLKAYDSMQGPVVGAITDEMEKDENLFTAFYYGEHYGTCFTKDTPITMADGTLQSIQNIKIGDLVITDKGRPQKVSYSFKKEYTGDLYEFQIKYRGQTPITATKEHPFLLGELYRNGKGQNVEIRQLGWKTSEEIHKLINGSTKEYFLYAPTFVSQPELVLDLKEELKHLNLYVHQGKVYPQNAMSQNAKGGVGINEYININGDVARLLGYYLAEGDATKYRISLSFNAHEDDLIEDACNIIKSQFGLMPTLKYTDNCCRIIVNSIILTQLLIKLCGQHAKHKRIDKRLIRLKVTTGLVYGYFKGDGWLSKSLTAGSFCSCNKQLLQQIKTILIGWGIPTTLFSRKRHILCEFKTHKINGIFDDHQLQIPKKYLNKFITTINNESYSAKNLHDDNVYVAYKILGVNRIKSQNITVYNLEVENDNTYLVDGLIVHNCVNRFIVQAVCGYPLTIYGKGGQQRGYINLNDSLQSVYLFATNPINAKELKIYHQMTETFNVNELAHKIISAGEKIGLQIKSQNTPNPRVENEDVKFYEPEYTSLFDLGLKPNFLTEEVIIEMLLLVSKYVKRINKNSIYNNCKWR